MGWKVVIDTTEIAANYSFNLSAEKRLNEHGVTEYVDVTIDLVGQVRESTASAVADKTKTYFDLAATTHKLVPVSIKLDDVEKFSFTPSASLMGPSVVSFETLPSDGAGGSRWKYAITLYARVRGNNFDGLYDLQTSLLVSRNKNGEVIRKVWKATAKAKTVALARSSILGFKPSGTKVEEEVEEFYQDRRVTGIWIWNRNYTAVIETINITGGAGYAIDPQVGKDAKPLLHVTRLQPIRAVVIGRATGDETLKAPAAHWKESATLKRLPREEVSDLEPSFKSPEDKDLAIWSFDFMEVWLCTEKKLPEPNHGDHAVGKSSAAAKEPAAGKIALSAGG